MEEIQEPEGEFWAKAGPPDVPRRLPGFTFLAWLAVIAAAACWQLLRSVAGQALAAGMPWEGTTLHTLEVFGAVVMAVAAMAVVLRRKA